MLKRIRADNCLIRACHKRVKALFDRYSTDRGNFNIVAGDLDG